MRIYYGQLNFGYLHVHLELMNVVYILLTELLGQAPHYMHVHVQNCYISFFHIHCDVSTNEAKPSVLNE